MARVDNPMFGWKQLWYEPKCVSFTEVNGKPSAILVATIVRRVGVGCASAARKSGEYLRWQVVDGDGRRPWRRMDLWSLQWYQPGDQRVLADSQPGCSDYVATRTLAVNYGNLVIH